MAQAYVLRFARSDDKSAFVLVQVTPKGSKRLDLKLVGTEGEAPYVASCKSSHSPSITSQSRNPGPQFPALTVVSLRVKNCPASEAEWQQILEDLFHQEPLPDIQATATVQSEKSISITIRKEIQGITQRLGSVTLHHDPDEAIELFEWCGAAVETSAASKQAVADLTVKSADLEAAVIQLQSQLEELIRAKEEDETTLLRKFRDLLNEKKVKIREQQQVLASTTFNASMPGHSQPSQLVEPKIEEPEEPRKPKKTTRQAGKSRASKRKTPASKRIEESEDEEDIQAMEVDNIKQEADDTDPGNTTEATASVDSDEDDEGGMAALSSSSQQQAASGSTTSTQKDKTPAKAAEQPPPRRDLPFQLRGSAKPAPAPTGSETESDDEL
ncbi:hypothetical protein FDECE_11410 [Fusarium decemcellulare]|nr:hypothetical protein FDECE_11410 [Fusarium decemcellulare]